MFDLERYEGREQTYVKHIVLKHYLQKLAYKIGWHRGALTYVDCFAGPWQHASERLKDTSPFIAIEELSAAREGLRARGRDLDLRCLFIEKKREAWMLLAKQLQSVKNIDAEAHHGSFEDQIEAIRSFVASPPHPFTFFFIDPTGWTGYPMDVIAPLLRHQPGEVLINFMTPFISRFIDNHRPEDVASFNRLFGSADYRAQWADLEGHDREDAILRAYCDRVREVGEFDFVTHTTILNPLSSRTHFNLIYATRHIEGLRVFRNDAERAADKEQPRASLQAQSVASGQGNLFQEPLGRTYFDEIRDRSQGQAKNRVQKLLEARRRVLFDDLEREALLFPHMRTAELKNWLIALKQQSAVRFEGLAPRARVPQAGQGHYVVLLKP